MELTLQRERGLIVLFSLYDLGATEEATAVGHADGKAQSAQAGALKQAGDFAYTDGGGKAVDGDQDGSGAQQHIGGNLQPFTRWR